MAELEYDFEDMITGKPIQTRKSCIIKGCLKIPETGHQFCNFHLKGKKHSSGRFNASVPNKCNGPKSIDKEEQ